MGSLRGQLIAACPIILLPQLALAEVCDKERPFWTAAQGKVGPLCEIAHLAVWPPGFVLFATLAAAIVVRSRWLAVLAALGAVALIALLYALGQEEVMILARAEGCVGNPTPAIMLIIAAVVAALARSFRPTRSA